MGIAVGVVHGIFEGCELVAAREHEADMAGAGDFGCGQRHALDGRMRHDYSRRATMSISTRASRARPVTPIQVLAGRRSAGKYEA